MVFLVRHRLPVSRAVRFKSGLCESPRTGPGVPTHPGTSGKPGTGVMAVGPVAKAKSCEHRDAPPVSCSCVRCSHPDIRDVVAGGD
jgi:hypothetical protein